APTAPSAGGPRRPRTAALPPVHTSSSDPVPTAARSRAGAGRAPRGQRRRVLRDRLRRRGRRAGDAASARSRAARPRAHRRAGSVARTAPPSPRPGVVELAQRPAGGAPPLAPALRPRQALHGPAGRGGGPVDREGHAVVPARVP